MLIVRSENGRLIEFDIRHADRANTKRDTAKPNVSMPSLLLCLPLGGDNFRW